MRPMKALFRSLLLWLLLLAIPFQGIASAGMLLCAPLPAAAHAVAAPAMAERHGHDHAAMLAAAADAGNSAHDGHDAHGPTKCGSSGACCIGAALAPSLPGALPELGVPSQSIPFYSGCLPAVDLALPERPPQAVQA